MWLLVLGIPTYVHLFLGMFIYPQVCSFIPRYVHLSPGMLIYTQVCSFIPQVCSFIPRHIHLSPGLFIYPQTFSFIHQVLYVHFSLGMYIYLCKVWHQKVLYKRVGKNLFVCFQSRIRDVDF